MPPRKPAKPAPEPLDFDGHRVLAMIGLRYDDPLIVGALADLGYTKPCNGDRVELRKLGISLLFKDKHLSQVQFELRRRWTGFAKYLGRLPYGISGDLKKVDALRVLADHAPAPERLDDNGWCQYEFPAYTIAMGFGKAYLETVFVMKPTS